MARKYSDETRALAVSLRVEKRLTVGQIMELTGCPKAIVCYWLRENPLTAEEIRKMYDGQPVRERLMAKIEIDPVSQCWLWTGRLSHNGYGRTSWKSLGTHQAHRVSYEQFVGPVPEGLILDHTCHKPENCAGGKSCPHRRCINPEHLEPVTIAENLKRGHGPMAGQAATVVAHRSATSCKHGHLYTPENTYTYHGLRHCKACAVIRSRARREKAKEPRRLNRVVAQ